MKESTLEMTGLSDADLDTQEGGETEKPLELKQPLAGDTTNTGQHSAS